MAFTTAFYVELKGIRQDLILNFFMFLEDDLIFRIVNVGIIIDLSNISL